MMQRRLLQAAAFALFLAACSLPWVGLWNPNGVADTGLYSLYGENLTHGLVPYRDYFMEFPPGAIPALVLPALPGSHYVAWFHIFEFMFGAGSLVCLGAILARIAPEPRRWIVPLAIAAIAPAILGPITLNSFDYWPTLLMTAAVAALVYDRPRTGFALLGAATAAKLFPVALLPVAIIFVVRRFGSGTWRAPLAAYAATIVGIFLPFAVLGPGGLRFSLKTQLERGLQLESLGASLLAAAHHLGLYRPSYTPNLAYAQLTGPLASVVATVSSIAMLAAIAAVAWRYRRADASAQVFVYTAAATVVATVAFAKVLSPQYLIWLIPLVAATALRSRIAPALLLVSLALTRIWVPDRFAELQSMKWVTWVLLGRNLVLVALFAASLVLLRRVDAPSKPQTGRQQAHRGR
jgi:uncharacterized membrane protein